MRSLVLVMVSFFLAACVPDGPQTVSRGNADYRGAVLKHLASSKSRIASTRGLGSCLLYDDNQWRMASPQIVVDTRENGLPLVTIQTTTSLNVNASRWYFNGDAAAGARAISGLERWARADAHSSTLPKERASGRFYPTYMLAGATLNSMFLLDNHPSMSDERRALITGWVDRMLKRTTVFGRLPRGGAGGRNDREQRINNHNSRRAFVLLQYGIYTNNAKWVNKSLSDMKRSHGNLDGNGVPKSDAARGDWALNYINSGMDTMTMHASFMDIIQPGYMANNSALMQKLDSGAAFLFREMRQPREIHGYASENFGRPQPIYDNRQDLWFTRKVAEGVNFAWIDNSAMDRYMPRAKAEMAATYRNNPWYRRAKWVHTNGNVTCWFP